MAEKLGQTLELMRSLSEDRRWCIGDQFFRLRREAALCGAKPGECPWEPIRGQFEICRVEGHAFIARKQQWQRMLFEQGGDVED